MKNYYVREFELLKVLQIPVLSDNYCYVVQGAGFNAAIDPGEAKTVLAVLREQNISLTHIINTHHHWDHTDGNLDLKMEFNCEVWGPSSEQIPGLTYGLNSGPLQIGQTQIQILSAPGHTLGHILLYFKDQNVLFTGDVLFCGGCGRVFEGSFEQMYNSLQEIKKLPTDTKIFCGHEYSLKNLSFAESVGIEVSKTKLVWEAQIKKAQPIVPTTLGLELSINPFLLAKNAEEFSKLRKLKDAFR